MVLPILVLVTFFQMENRPGTTSDKCREISIIVKSANGIAIVDAVAADEAGVVASRTDYKGVAVIPCRFITGQSQVVQVHAPGYNSTTFLISSESRSDLTVFLEEANSTVRASRKTIGVSELSNTPRDLIELQKEAGKALAREDYGNAEKLLLKALELAPSSPWILNNLGIIALHRQDLDSAAMLFEKAAGAAASISDILANLGLVRWMQSRKEESYAALTRAVSLGCRSATTRYLLGILALERSQVQEAVENLKRVSSDQFPYRDLFLSIAFRTLHREKDAEKSYRNFRRNHPVRLIEGSLSKQE